MDLSNPNNTEFLMDTLNGPGQGSNSSEPDKEDRKAETETEEDALLMQKVLRRRLR
jgi:hypothetical protein